MVPRLVFQADSAFGTQTLAVFPAHRLERQCCYHCVPQHRLEIDFVVLDSTLFFFVLALEMLGILVGEKLLHIDLQVILKGIQASAAFARHMGVYGSGNQNSFVYGLQPQIKAQFRAFLNADERHTEILRRGYMFSKRSHRPRAAPEVLDVERQGRTFFAVNGNS